MTDREPSQLVSEAADNLRIFNHQTRTEQLTDRCIIAPDAYTILGSATELAYSLPQALSQLSDALRRSLAVFDIYDQDRDPVDSVTIATHAIPAAADAFTKAAQHLSDAQAAIAHQRVIEDSAGNLRRRPTLQLAPSGPDSD